MGYTGNYDMNTNLDLSSSKQGDDHVKMINILDLSISDYETMKILGVGLLPAVGIPDQAAKRLAARTPLVLMAMACQTPKLFNTLW